MTQARKTDNRIHSSKGVYEAKVIGIVTADTSEIERKRPVIAFDRRRSMSEHPLDVGCYPFPPSGKERHSRQS